MALTAAIGGCGLLLGSGDGPGPGSRRDAGPDGGHDGGLDETDAATAEGGAGDASIDGGASADASTSGLRVGPATLQPAEMLAIAWTDTELVLAALEPSGASAAEVALRVFAPGSVDGSFATSTSASPACGDLSLATSGAELVAAFWCPEAPTLLRTVTGTRSTPVYSSVSAPVYHIEGERSAFVYFGATGPRAVVRATGPAGAPSEQLIDIPVPSGPWSGAPFFTSSPPLGSLRASDTAQPAFAVGSYAHLFTQTDGSIAWVGYGALEVSQPRRSSVTVLADRSIVAIWSTMPGTMTTVRFVVTPAGGYAQEAPFATGWTGEDPDIAAIGAESLAVWVSASPLGIGVGKLDAIASPQATCVIPASGPAVAAPDIACDESWCAIAWVEADASGARYARLVQAPRAAPMAFCM